MTIEVSVKQIPAGKFKSECLAIMDQVQASGEAVVVTKHGKPVVKLIPAKQSGDDIFGFMEGKGKIVGDIMNTIPAGDWDLK